MFVLCLIAGGCVSLQRREPLAAHSVRSAFKLKTPRKIVSGTAYVTMMDDSVLIEVKDAMGHSAYVILLDRRNAKIFSTADNCCVTIKRWVHHLNRVTGASCDFSRIQRIFTPATADEKSQKFVYQKADRDTLVLKRGVPGKDHRGSLEIRLPEYAIDMTFRWKSKMNPVYIDSGLLDRMIQAPNCDRDRFREMISNL